MGAYGVDELGHDLSLTAHIAASDVKGHDFDPVARERAYKWMVRRVDGRCDDNAVTSCAMTCR
jgi:hypothetical protein